MKNIALPDGNCLAEFGLFIPRCPISLEGFLFYHNYFTGLRSNAIAVTTEHKSGHCTPIPDQQDVKVFTIGLQIKKKTKQNKTLSYLQVPTQDKTRGIKGHQKDGPK